MKEIVHVTFFCVAIDYRLYMVKIGMMKLSSISTGNYEYSKKIGI